MSNGKPCKAHNIPVDICARCRGAAEERQRILEILKDDDKVFYENGECQLENHWPEMCHCSVIKLIEEQL